MALPPHDSSASSVRVAVAFDAAVDHLLGHVSSGFRGDSTQFCNLCNILSRAIDYKVANNEVLEKAKDLPILLIQICQRNHNNSILAAIMVLMVSVKSACKSGWFSEKDNAELISLADEIASRFSGSGDIATGPNCCLSNVEKVMERFYPMMKMGTILASLEAKPGYGTIVIDFDISKSTVYSPQEKTRLLIAQIDNMETSSCIISPQKVNFLLNGKGVDNRITTSMDTGPQLPSDVTQMLRFGTNLLQAVGQFNGHYVIVVAFMSMASSLDISVLKDYVQPSVSSTCSDIDILEGPSRISLNCPISSRRIKTPVKGHMCKHLESFDLSNFLSMNGRLPRWRCPHCDQYVCYLDIRVDQNMVKVLREVGDDVSRVNISVDGSWKAVWEDDDDDDEDMATNVMDLTNDDDTEMDTVGVCEAEDIKPSINANSAQAADGYFLPNNSLTSTQFRYSIAHGPNPLQPSALFEANSLVLNQEGVSHWNTGLVLSSMHNTFSTPNNLHSQQWQSANPVASNEYGTSQTIPRELASRLQALPAQTLGMQQRPRTSFINSTPTGASSSSQAGQSVTLPASVLNAVCSDLKRQQYFTRPQMNPVQVSDTASSSMHYGLRATQNWVPTVSSLTRNQSGVGLPDSSQLQSARSSSGLHGFTNAHLQRKFNSTTPLTLSQSSSSHPSRSHVMQRSAQVEIDQTPSLDHQQSFIMATQRAALARHSSPMPTQGQTSRSSSVNAGRRRASGDQRGNIRGTVQSVSVADGMVNSPSEQDWRPAGRMRGSLTGQAYIDALNQFIVMPTQSSESLGPPPPLLNPPPPQLSRPPHLTSRRPKVPFQLQASTSTQVPRPPNSHPQ